MTPCISCKEPVPDCELVEGICSVCLCILSLETTIRILGKIKQSRSSLVNQLLRPWAAKAWEAHLKQQKLSKCCLAPMTVKGDTTHWYECDKCHQPCDIHVFDQNFLDKITTDPMT